jgi:hypothetical protein
MLLNAQSGIETMMELISLFQHIPQSSRRNPWYSDSIAVRECIFQQQQAGYTGCRRVDEYIYTGLTSSLHKGV